MNRPTKRERATAAAVAFHARQAALFKANQAKRFMGPIDLTRNPENWSDLQGLVWYVYHKELARRHENERLVFATICGWEEQ